MSKQKPTAPLNLAPVDINQRYKVDEAARYLRCGRARIYQKFAAGQLRRIVDGGRVYVPGSEIARLAQIDP